jgi:uncharacterized membrane protein YadS
LGPPSLAEQFGLWSALAIHDTSSVVGATAAKYGAVALVYRDHRQTRRALWIVPLAIGTAAAKKTKGQIQWPWFILFFGLAAVVNTFFPVSRAYSTASLSTLGRLGLTATLYLIGTGLSRATIKESRDSSLPPRCCPLDYRGLLYLWRLS